MDQVEVSKSIEAQLLNLTITIYRKHWMDKMQVDERAMISRESLSHQVDLQPVLQAIVSQTLPAPVHEQVSLGKPFPGFGGIRQKIGRFRQKFGGIR